MGQMNPGRARSSLAAAAGHRRNHIIHRDYHGTRNRAWESAGAWGRCCPRLSLDAIVDWTRDFLKLALPARTDGSVQDDLQLANEGPLCSAARNPWPSRRVTENGKPEGVHHPFAEEDYSSSRRERYFLATGHSVETYRRTNSNLACRGNPPRLAVSAAVQSHVRSRKVEGPSTAPWFQPLILAQAARWMFGTLRHQPFLPLVTCNFPKYH